MNELQVVVKQEVGKINWNFEELKTALATEMKKYTGIVFDDDSIADAKKTVAYLRKLKESVEDRRKDVKKKCLEPYNEMEKQAKELTQLIDEPINTIAKQVKDYEEEQKKKKKEEILAYMAEVFAELPETVASKLKSKIYDSKWENKSTTKKTWQDAVNTAFENTKGDLNILDGIEEDFREDAKKVYERNLVLSEALSKVQELRKQKEMILERERQKREREEAAKREALAKKEEQPQEPEKAPEPVASAEPKCKKKHTKYVRNKQFGMKLPEETNTVKFRDALIYTATVEADREKLWDNKKVWESLRAKDLQIMNGLDVIEYCLKAGEKDKIIECIDSLSGFEENIEEVAKN